MSVRQSVAAGRRGIPLKSWHVQRDQPRAPGAETALGDSYLRPFVRPAPPSAGNRLILPRASRGLAIVLLLVFSTGATAIDWPWSLPVEPPQQPHPSVVRVSVDESDGIAHGSGTLVDVRERFGLIVTNWHVVRDATGPIHVVFSDGFRSAAQVLRVDRDWDLAALLIWRPRASPVPLATKAPQPGELLTIAGYGTGNYRSVTGRCTQYVAPSDRHPFEMVEVAARARQGDSGGPIFNASGELAGVLFGSGGGTTSGSYAGRVHQFLSTAWPPGQESEFPQLLAGASQNAPATAPSAPRFPSHMRRLPNSSAGQTPPAEDGPSTFGNATAGPGNFRTEDRGSGKISQLEPLPHTVRPLPPDPEDRSGAGMSGSGETGTSEEPTSVHATTISWHDIAGDTIFQQCKTFLAILGLFTLLAQFMRLFRPSIDVD